MGFPPAQRTELGTATQVKACTSTSSEGLILIAFKIAYSDDLPLSNAMADFAAKYLLNHSSRALTKPPRNQRQGVAKTLAAKMTSSHAAFGERPIPIIVFFMSF